MAPKKLVNAKLAKSDSTMPCCVAKRVEKQHDANSKSVANAVLRLVYESSLVRDELRSSRKQAWALELKKLETRSVRTVEAQRMHRKHLSLEAKLRDQILLRNRVNGHEVWLRLAKTCTFRELHVEVRRTLQIPLRATSTSVHLAYVGPHPVLLARTDYITSIEFTSGDLIPCHLSRCKGGLVGCILDYVKYK